MTTGTYRSQGTELYWVDASITGGGSSDPEVLKVDCATAISGLGGAADQIDITCLDTIGDKEFVAGLGNPGDITVGINLIKTSIAHRSLFEMKKHGTVVDWMAALSDSTEAVTVDSNGVMQRPAARSAFAFAGFVKDFNIEIGTNDIVRATLVIQRSGNVTFYVGT